MKSHKAKHKILSYQDRSNSVVGLDINKLSYLPFYLNIVVKFNENTEQNDHFYVKNLHTLFKLQCIFIKTWILNQKNELNSSFNHDNLFNCFTDGASPDW